MRVRRPGRGGADGASRRIGALGAAGGEMTGPVDCPSWCAEDVADVTGVRHRLVIGEVRLTRVTELGTRRTICAVRRRRGRSPADVARLWADLIEASDLLLHERAKRRTEFHDNWAAPSNAQLAMN